MITFVKKYNFAKFINFIRSIDGDFNNASIEYITDAIYDDTYDNNEDELDNNPTYVLSLCKGIYEEKINEWLELN